MRALNPTAVQKLEQIKCGDLPYPPMWKTIAIALVDIEPGRVRMTARADERHTNAFGTVHGGYAATALDTALGLTVFISLDDEQARHTTVDLAIKVVKRIPLHTDLVIETELVHISRSVGVSSGVIRDAAGVVYAHGTTTCLIKH